jgi:RimJ/RimL family protein N-acetyltransferase
MIVPTPLMEILAGNVLIRPWQPADAGPVYRACQDPDIQRWTRMPSPYLPRHATGFVTGLSPKAWSEGSGAPLGVFDATTGELLGSCGLTAIRDGTGELGYWTAPWARGRGVAVTAVRAVTALAFEKLGLHRVGWRALVGNHASRLVALRAGIRMHGRTRIVDEPGQGWTDAWWGTLLPGEVTAQAPPAYAPGSLAARRAAVYCGRQPRLRGLVPPRAADIELITAACRDEESARWTTIPVPYARTDAEFYVLRHAPLIWAAGEGAVYQIVDGRNDFVGTADLRIDPADEASAEVGFLVAPWARGRGHATRALRSLCAWGFEALGLARIVWRAQVGNEASRRVAIKAGFTLEGVQRSGSAERGGRRDAWVGSRLPADPA